MSHLEVAPVDETLARRAAALRQRAIDATPASTPSATDALVAAEAERAGGTLVITGDRDDLAPLAAASGAFGLKALDEVAAGN